MIFFFFFVCVDCGWQRCAYFFRMMIKTWPLVAAYLITDLIHSDFLTLSSGDTGADSLSSDMDESFIRFRIENFFHLKRLSQGVRETVERTIHRSTIFSLRTLSSISESGETSQGSFLTAGDPPASTSSIHFNLWQCTSNFTFCAVFFFLFLFTSQRSQKVLWV